MDQLTLAQILMEVVPEKFSNPPAAYDKYVEKYGKGMTGGEMASELMQQAPLALAGLRAPSAVGSMRPFNPRAPEAPLPKRPDGEAVAQGLYEAALGRPSGGGPGSGHWYPFGVPVSKSPIAHALAAGTGYGIFNALGGPEAASELWNQPWNTPGTPEYDEQQKRRAGIERDRRALESRPQEMEALYGPESMQYGLPYGMEGMRRLGQLSQREATLPSQNGIPFPPDPNKP